MRQKKAKKLRKEAIKIMPESFLNKKPFYPDHGWHIDVLTKIDRVVSRGIASNLYKNFIRRYRKSNS